MNPPPLRRLWTAGLLAVTVLAGCATAPPPASPPPAVVVRTAPSTEVPPAATDTESSSATEAAVIVPDPVTDATPAAEDGEAASIDPKVPDALTERDLWVRIRRGFAIPDLEGDLVRDREQWYADRPDYVQRMMARASRYLYYIVEEIERRGMPTELALLPFIESAFNPQAMSPAKASGMWQFIPSTGRHFDLRQNIFRDERRDVMASTRAALDYLARLHEMFGDWHLALAAYNWGEGSVQRAIARNRKAGLPTDYASLRMPAETRLYVPKFQAVKNIVASPESFGLTLPLIENHPYFLTVAIQRDIDVDLAVELAGLPKEEFHALNPQMNKPVILAAGVPHILLPYDNANRFVRALADHKGPLASWTAWVVPRTMSPKEAAAQVGMSEQALRTLNKIPPRMLVKAGSTLLVPRSERHHAQDVPEHIADNAMMALTPDAPPARRLVVRAGKRDTVASIAKRYKVSASQVAQWNKVSAGATFAKGQKVVVYTTVHPAAQASAKSARPAGKTRQAGAAPAKASKTASAKAGNSKKSRTTTAKAVPKKKTTTAKAGSSHPPATSTKVRVARQ